jgi:hypothetical protein
MTLVRAPNTRSAIPFSFVRNGDAVGAGEWSRAGLDVNYAAAAGRVVVPSFRPAVPLDLVSADHIWYWSLWIEPAYQAIQRQVTIVYRLHAFGDPIRANGMGDLDVSQAKVDTITTLGSQTTTGGAIDVSIDVTSAGESGYCTVDGIMVTEIPRTFVETDANERGVDISAFTSGQPIAIGLGVDALRDATDTDTEIGRRVLLHFAAPYRTDRQTADADEAGAGGDPITSGSYVTVAGSGVPVLARKRRTSDTTRVVKCRVFGRCSNGTTTGEVRFVSSENGASSAIAFDGSVTTSFAWSAEVDLTVDCEDMSAAQGLQGGAWDEVTVEARRTAGAGTLFVCGWVIYEDGP